MDVYAIVTEKIISLLEEGLVPWRRPWVTTGLPRNLISKKPYKGINLFLTISFELCLAILADYSAGGTTQRVCSQRRKGNVKCVLEDRRKGVSRHR